ncbi:TPR domain containing protein [Beggiatoa sp. PS]|nr:TPR domain containing protein [Beggiatoa sp. PS]
MFTTSSTFISQQQEYMYKALIADIARLRGNNILATAYFLDIAQKARHEQVAERATQVAWQAKQYDQAIEAARLWVTLAPNNPKARQFLGQFLLQQQRTEEAIEHLDVWLNTFKEEPQKQRNIIEALLEQQADQDEVLELMEKLVAKQPNDPARLLIYSRLLLNANDIEKAQNVLRTLLASIPDHEQAVPLYAYSLEKQNQPQMALQWMKDVLSQYPDKWDWRFMYARMLTEKEQHDKAIEQFQLLLSQYPQHKDILYALGILSLQTGQPSAAKDYFTELQKIGERVNLASYYLGQIAHQEKDFKNALHWYQQVQEGPNYLNAVAQVALILVEQGQFDKALEYLHTVQVNSSEDEINLLLLEAELLIEQKRYSQAMEAYNSALQLKPNHTDVLYSRALLAEKMGFMEQMEQDLRRILVINPNNSEALNALGYSIADYADRSETARLEEAYHLIKQALALTPDNHYILDSMGWVLYKQGNYADAIAYLRKAQAKQADPEIAAHLGEVLWNSGDRQSAGLVWETALSDFPNDEKLQEVVRQFLPALLETLQGQNNAKKTKP